MIFKVNREVTVTDPEGGQGNLIENTSCSATQNPTPLIGRVRVTVRRCQEPVSSAATFRPPRQVCWLAARKTRAPSATEATSSISLSSCGHASHPSPPTPTHIASGIAVSFYDLENTRIFILTLFFFSFSPFEFRDVGG